MSRISSRSMNNRMGTMVPDRVRVKLRIMAANTLSGAVTLAATFSMNNLFDPFLGGGASQPIGFDQWCSFYQKYQVHASKIIFKYVNLSVTDGMWISIFPSPISTNVLSVTTCGTQPYSKYKITGPSSGNDIIVISNYCSCAKIVGRTIKYDQNFCGTATSNPGTQLYWQFNGQSLAGATNINANGFIEIYYWCEFWSRFQVDTS